MSGLDVAQGILKLSANVRLVAMTGSPSPRDVANALVAGFSSWLGKPFEIEDLEALLITMPRVAHAANAP